MGMRVRMEISGTHGDEALHCVTMPVLVFAAIGWTGTVFQKCGLRWWGFNDLWSVREAVSGRDKYLGREADQMRVIVSSESSSLRHQQR